MATVTVLAKVASRSKGSIALDQWRGLALVMVLISHGFLHTGRTWGIGRIGVNLFFFISGILVYKSLNKPGSARELAIDFWKKRLRRLYPALLGYVVLMAPVVYYTGNILKLPDAADLHSFLLGDRKSVV